LVANAVLNFIAWSFPFADAAKQSWSISQCQMTVAGTGCAGSAPWAWTRRRT